MNWVGFLHADSDVIVFLEDWYHTLYLWPWNDWSAMPLYFFVFKLVMIYIFFYFGFLSGTFMIHRTAWKEEGYFLSPTYHFQPLHRHLDIT